MERNEYLWRPQDPPRAVVVLVHGFCEHAGRYAGLAARMNQSGIAVTAGDLRGHGRSPGPRIWVRRFDEYVDDAAEDLVRAGTRFPGLPVFLMGFSMGGLIALRIALYRGIEVRGLVLASPAVMVGQDIAPWLRHVAPLASLLVPWLRLVRVNARYLSHDPRVVAEFDNDPLCFHGRFPVRTGVELLVASEQVRADLSRLSLPLLALHGTDDRLTDPEGSRLACQQAVSADKTLKLYPGLCHDLFHDPQGEPAINDLLAWLSERCDH